MSYVPSLKKLYNDQVVPELVKSRGYKNKHEVPKLVKISINTGISAEAAAEAPAEKPARKPAKKPAKKAKA